MKVFELLPLIRKEISKINYEIANHEVIKLAEKGKLEIEKIKKFVSNEKYISFSDMKALALALSKCESLDEAEILYDLIGHHLKAMEELNKLYEEIKAVEEPSPSSFNYAHYFLWLSWNLSTEEFLSLVFLNFPVWTKAAYRFKKALRKNYEIKNLGFFPKSLKTYKTLEEKFKNIAKKELDYGKLLSMARILQTYEKSFWDSLIE